MEIEKIRRLHNMKDSDYPSQYVDFSKYREGDIVRNIANSMRKRSGLNNEWIFGSPKIGKTMELRHLEKCLSQEGFIPVLIDFSFYKETLDAGFDLMLLLLYSASTLLKKARALGIEFTPIQTNEVIKDFTGNLVHKSKQTGRWGQLEGVEEIDDLESLVDIPKQNNYFYLPYYSSLLQWLCPRKEPISTLLFKEVFNPFREGVNVAFNKDVVVMFDNLNQFPMEKRKSFNHARESVMRDTFLIKRMGLNTISAFTEKETLHEYIEEGLDRKGREILPFKVCDETVNLTLGSFEKRAEVPKEEILGIFEDTLLFKELCFQGKGSLWKTQALLEEAIASVDLEGGEKIPKAYFKKPLIW